MFLFFSFKVFSNTPFFYLFLYFPLFKYTIDLILLLFKIFNKTILFTITNMNLSELEQYSCDEKIMLDIISKHIINIQSYTCYSHGGNTATYFKLLMS